MTWLAAREETLEGRRNQRAKALEVILGYNDIFGEGGCLMM